MKGKLILAAAYASQSNQLFTIGSPHRFRGSPHWFTFVRPRCFDFLGTFVPVYEDIRAALHVVGERLPAVSHPSARVGEQDDDYDVLLCDFIW